MFGAVSSDHLEIDKSGLVLPADSNVEMRDHVTVNML